MNTDHRSAPDAAATPNPYTRPTFVASAAVVVVVLICLVGLLVARFTGNDDSPAAPPSPTSTGAEGRCQDTPSVSDVVPTAAPEATWQTNPQTLVEYPVSPKFGPAVVDADVRRCFEHSPTGALFAAVNAVDQSAGPHAHEFFDYFIAPGPEHDALLGSGPGSSGTNGVRMSISGFRILDYTGDSAVVDVALTGQAQGTTILMTAAYPLAWHDGDWRLVVYDVTAPLNMAAIMTLEGYTLWGNR